MSKDCGLAFGALSDRAAAMGADVLDRISLRDYNVEVEIGAFQAERGLLQRVQFNVVVEVASIAGLLDDDVDRILSYDRITEAIDGELGIERLNLLETLAERVADRILMEPQAERVFIRIEKLDKGPFALGVEIVRQKGQGQWSAKQSAPRPVVIAVSRDLLSNLQLLSQLPDAVHKTCGGGQPLVVFMPDPEQDRPEALSQDAKICIGLLAREQAAWSCASALGDCHVVGSKTELDWAIKNDKLCVWAPSNMVLSVPSVDLSFLDEDTNLLGWFARKIGAHDVISASVYSGGIQFERDVLGFDTSCGVA